MEEALGKSLDELIAENRKKPDTKTQKKEARRGQRTGGGGEEAPRARGPRRQSGGAGRAPKTISITVRGGVGKGAPRQQRGGGAPLREEREQDPHVRAAALEGGAKWGHDAFSGPRGGGAGGGARRGPRGPRDPTTLGTKLFISNLHYDVTAADIKELFETCGRLVKHMVHYDNSGRSEGTAEVIYEQAGDAERGLRRYNTVQLDGQAMQIELIPQAAPGEGGARGGGNGGPRTLSSGIRISGERGGGGPRLVQVTRHFQQAAPKVVRGRGSVRSRGGRGVAAMED